MLDRRVLLRVTEMYANLNRLSQLREQGVAPQGRRSTTGPQERSKPTGFTHKAGNVTIQELEFSNGYIVGALQIEGQKAIIKGPEAMMNFLVAVDKGYVQEAADAWLKHVDKGLRTVTVSNAVRAEQSDKGHPIPALPDKGASSDSTTQAVGEATEGRIGQLEETVDNMGSQLNEILRILQSQPKVS